MKTATATKARRTHRGYGPCKCKDGCGRWAPANYGVLAYCEACRALRRTLREEGCKNVAALYWKMTTIIPVRCKAGCGKLALGGGGALDYCEACNAKRRAKQAKADQEFIEPGPCLGGCGATVLGESGPAAYCNRCWIDHRAGELLREMPEKAALAMLDEIERRFYAIERPA